jgi:hypothetical protein
MMWVAIGLVVWVLVLLFAIGAAAAAGRPRPVPPINPALRLVTDDNATDTA